MNVNGSRPACLYNDPSVFVKTEFDTGSPDASMSTVLWAKTQQLQEDAFRQLQNIYGDHFPLEARHHLAPWLEQNFTTELDLANPQHEEHAQRLVLELVAQLESKAMEMTDFLIKNKLEQIVENFKQRYAHNPLSLYQTVQQCLNSEMHLVQRSEGVGVDPSTAMANDTIYQIQQQLNMLKKSTQECGVEIEKTRQMQEHHSINFYKHHQISVQLDSGQFQENSQEYLRWKEWRDKVAAELRQSFNNLKLQTSTLANRHLDMIKQVKELQYRVLDQELNKWKREQQLSGNGAPFSNNLDTIQKWCEDLAEIIWLNRQQIRQLEMIQEGLNIPSQETSMNILPELSDGLNVLLDSLVKSSFVIEKQPPQVLKTNTRFSATIRLLVGTKLNVHMSPPVVTASIISESQANSLLRAGHTKKTSSGDIVNNKQTMEYHQATGQLSVSFRNMSLKKIKRAEKKGTESVMDEKFALLFWSEFSIGNGEFHYQVCAPSLPVVVIVHGNQEPHAWATILWDNAFAEWGRQPFLVPEKVPWIQVANTLNMKFKASCGRGLTEENLKFLAGKAFSFRNMGYNADCSNLMITWSQFCKEPLPDRSFTFWEWFYAVMKLTKEDLRGMWIDGALLGFVSRQQAEEFLQASEVGTFLIRFSDSELGGVTVAWISLNEDTNQKEVAMLQPFTRKDLMIRSLPDRIHDCPQMIHLYPAIPKDQAFGKYYSSPPETVPRNTRNGYVPHHLVNVIPGPLGLGKGTDSYPGTPATSFYDPQSPPSARNTPLSSVSVPMMDSQSGGYEGELGPGKGGGLMRELDNLQMDDFTDLCQGFNK